MHEVLFAILAAAAFGEIGRQIKIYNDDCSSLHPRLAPAFVPSGVSGDRTYKLGTDALSAPPDHLICAVLSNFITVEKQHKFIDNIYSIDVQTHAFGGNIGD